MRRPDLGVTFLLAALASAAGAEPAREAPAGGGLFDGGQLGSRKEPITVTSDTLDYDYKNNIVVYHGDVNAVQGQVKLRSNRLTVTLERAPAKNAAKGDPSKDPPKPDPSAKDKDNQKVREIIAEGNVRIDSGTRWATGGKATFEQTTRTVVLTDNPKLHDGENEVAGDRVIVYLDEDRSVVEGGRKRVKAVLYPGKDSGLAPKDTTGTPSGARDAEAPVVQGDVRAPAAGAACP